MLLMLRGCSPVSLIHPVIDMDPLQGLHANCTTLLSLLTSCVHQLTCKLLLYVGHFSILSHKEKGLPLVAFSLNDTVEKDGKHHKRNYSEYDIADRLRMHHW